MEQGAQCRLRGRNSILNNELRPLYIPKAYLLNRALELRLDGPSLQLPATNHRKTHSATAPRPCEVKALFVGVRMIERNLLLL